MENEIKISYWLKIIEEKVETVKNAIELNMYYKNSKNNQERFREQISKIKNI